MVRFRDLISDLISDEPRAEDPDPHGQPFEGLTVDEVEALIRRRTLTLDFRALRSYVGAMRTRDVPAAIRKAAGLLEERGLYLPHPAYEPRDGALTPIEAVQLAAGDDAEQVLAWLADDPMLYPEPGVTGSSVAAALRTAAHRIISGSDYRRQLRREAAGAEHRLADELLPQWCRTWAGEHQRNEVMIEVRTDGVHLMRGVPQPGGGTGWRHRLVGIGDLQAAAEKAHGRRRNTEAAEAATIAVLDERLTALLDEPVRWTTDQAATHLHVSTSRLRALMAAAGIRQHRSDETWDADRVIAFAGQRPGQGARTDLAGHER